MLYEPSEENTALCVKHETSAQRETRGEKKNARLALFAFVLLG